MIRLYKIVENCFSRTSNTLRNTSAGEIAGEEAIGFYNKISESFL
jgi:hypothetical protein